MALAVHPVYLAGQSNTVSMIFVVDPPTPVANKPLIFYFDVSDGGGVVQAVLVTLGASCAQNAKLSVAFQITPPKSSGEITLTTGLPAGQYSAYAEVEGTSSATNIRGPCSTFTVATN
jgi:nucleoid-associated protein YgaU